MQTLPQTASLGQAIRLRMMEARRALILLEQGLEAIAADEANLNWADCGSLAHVVETLEDAARFLGVLPGEVEDET